VVGARGVLAALGLVVLFAFGLSWFFSTLCLLLRTPNAVMNAGLMGIFPLTFLSNVFVDPTTLPGPLEPFVAVNPIFDPRHGITRADGGQRRRHRHRHRAGRRRGADGGLRTADHAALPPELTRVIALVRSCRS